MIWNGERVVSELSNFHQNQGLFRCHSMTDRFPPKRKFVALKKKGLIL